MRRSHTRRRERYQNIVINLYFGHGDGLVCLLYRTPFSLYPLKKSGAQRNATPAKSSLVDSDAHLSQFGLGLVNLGHELLVRLRHVVEGEDAEAEAEEEDGAKGDEGPKGELKW